MPRLPQPGGDQGSWGHLLNDFLAVEHDTEGRLKIRTEGIFVRTTTDQTIAGVKTFTSSPIVPTPTSNTQAANKSYVDSVATSGAPDASSSTKGLVQLTGDLGGTAASPTVPQLSSKANDNQVVHLAGAETITGNKNFTGTLQHNGTAVATASDISSKANDNQVVHLTGAETVAGVKTFTSSPVVPTPTSNTQAANKAYVDSAASAGAPDATSSTKGLVQLTGDLGGTAASPTVPGLASKADDSLVVHLSGSETITGNKNFTGTLQQNGSAVVTTGDSRLTNTRTPSDASVTVAKLNTTNSGSDGNVLSYDSGSLTWITPPTGGSGSPGSTAAAAILVASKDMPQEIKDAADYVCDGTNDQVEINSAIAAATGQGGRGKVQLTGGVFIISGSILMRTGVWLAGSGVLTELRASSLSAATGSGSEVAIIKLNDVNVHVAYVSDLWLNGNFASGGTGSGICFVSATSGDDQTGYPNTDPDPDCNIRNLLITGFTNGSARHGIHMKTDMRGTIIHNLQMRGFSGHGIYMESSPDSHISNVHIGGAADAGYMISGGNVKLTNCKAFYCNNWGFNITSGRGSLTGCESQDNVNGVRLASANIAVAGLVIDTSQTTSLEVAANHLTITGLMCLNRGNGRYTTTASGVVFTGTPSNVTIIGGVNTSDITTAVSGTYTAATNFIRLSTTGALTSHGT